jgi:hypothetical protein
MAFTKQHIRFLSVMTTTFLLLFGLLFSAFAFGSRPVLANSGRDFTAGSGFYQQTNLVFGCPRFGQIYRSASRQPLGDIIFIYQSFLDFGL